MLEQIHIQTMQPLVGQSFDLRDVSQEYTRLTLTAVEVREDNQEFENFSLIFSGPEQPFLPQSTYRLIHPNLNPFEIFLVPIARTGQTYLYEAVFNLIKEPSA